MGSLVQLLGSYFSPCYCCPSLMISEQFPKLNTDNKVPGAKDWFQSLCAVLAQAHWQLCRSQIHTLFLRGTNISAPSQAQLCIYFPGCVILAGVTAGTRDSTGCVREEPRSSSIPGASSACFPCPVPVSHFFCHWWRAGVLTALRQQGREKGFGAHSLPAQNGGGSGGTGWHPGLLSPPVGWCLGAPANLTRTICLYLGTRRLV